MSSGTAGELGHRCSPRGTEDLDQARTLRARWKHASDDEFTGSLRAAFTTMTMIPGGFFRAIDKFLAAHPPRA